MPKKLTSLYLPKSDKDALVIAGECVPAGKAVANPDNILRTALIEGKNHKIASVVRLHDHPLELIEPQIVGKKAIPYRRLCQILIPAIAEKKSLFAPPDSQENSILPPSGRKKSRHTTTTLRYTRHKWCENELFASALHLTKGESLCFRMYS
jgi:hypothetical protein